MQTITHITLVTGHSAITARSDVSDEVLMRLQPIIDAESGVIVEAGVYIDLIRPLDTMTHKPLNGAAAWTIMHGLEPSSPPIAQCFVCWKSEFAAECWQRAEAMQGASPHARMPKITPWLAVVILPSIALASRETVAMLGDLERCLAWAIIETPL